MGKQRVKYSVIDAFTNEPFKGNPAAICLLENDNGDRVDDEWMQKLAMEFNISETAFLIREQAKEVDYSSVERYRLRWFTPVAEVDLCGHATLAAAHFLFESGLVRSDLVEFVTRSGILAANKLPALKQLNSTVVNVERKDFSIELNFPMIQASRCDPEEFPVIPETLNGAAVASIQKTLSSDDFIVEVASGKDVVGLSPNFDELQRCPGRGVIITGAAPSDSGFDFFSRFFCPKLGVNEDPVCGSAHCALAPYWSKKLGKTSLVAYMASPRGGRLDLELEEHTSRVRIRGEAVIVMDGFVLV